MKRSRDASIECSWLFSEDDDDTIEMMYKTLRQIERKTKAKKAKVQEFKDSHAIMEEMLAVTRNDTFRLVLKKRQRMIEEAEAELAAMNPQHISNGLKYCENRRVSQRARITSSG